MKALTPGGYFVVRDALAELWAEALAALVRDGESDRAWITLATIGVAHRHQ